MNTYGYVFNNPLGYIDPFGLDSLVADSSTGVITHYNDAGQPIGSYSYTSGRNGITDPSISWQGPIPLGTYTLNPKEITEGGWLRNLTGDWGKYRAPLHPVDGTKTFGRAGFFIHGGKEPGSAGCIDVGVNDQSILGPKSHISRHNGPVRVIIK